MTQHKPTTRILAVATRMIPRRPQAHGSTTLRAWYAGSTPHGVPWYAGSLTEALAMQDDLRAMWARHDGGAP